MFLKHFLLNGSWLIDILFICADLLNTYVCKYFSVSMWMWVGLLVYLYKKTSENCSYKSSQICLSLFRLLQCRVSSISIPILSHLICNKLLSYSIYCFDCDLNWILFACFLILNIQSPLNYCFYVFAAPST